MVQYQTKQCQTKQYLTCATLPTTPGERAPMKTPPRAACTDAWLMPGSSGSSSLACE